MTQHPQHLPDELFGLINNYVLHRINDAGVISRLKHSIGGIDEGLWDRLTALAPGQAIATFAHMARPLLVAVDPTPASCAWRRSDPKYLTSGSRGMWFTHLQSIFQSPNGRGKSRHEPYS